MLLQVLCSVRVYYKFSNNTVYILWQFEWEVINILYYPLMIKHIFVLIVITFAMILYIL